MILWWYRDFLMFSVRFTHMANHASTSNLYTLSVSLHLGGLVRLKRTIVHLNKHKQCHLNLGVHKPSEPRTPEKLAFLINPEKVFFLKISGAVWQKYIPNKFVTLSLCLLLCIFGIDVKNDSGSKKVKFLVPQRTFQWTVLERYFFSLCEGHFKNLKEPFPLFYVIERFYPCWRFIIDANKKLILIYLW